MKKCSICRQKKPRSEFYKNGLNYSGRCIPCTKMRRRKKTEQTRGVYAYK